MQDQFTSLDKKSRMKRKEREKEQEREEGKSQIRPISPPIASNVSKRLQDSNIVST